MIKTIQLSITVFIGFPDDPHVATVDNKGLVTRITGGKCNITATVGTVGSNKCAVKCG